MKQNLCDIAHDRAGDKGNAPTLSLIPYKEEDDNLLCRQATTESVKEHLKENIRGDLVRYELPNIAALQFVCQQALSGGIPTSMVMDAHVKTLGYALLGMDIDI